MISARRTKVISKKQLRVSIAHTNLLKNTKQTKRNQNNVLIWLAVQARTHLQIPSASKLPSYTTAKIAGALKQPKH